MQTVNIKGPKPPSHAVDQLRSGTAHRHGGHSRCPSACRRHQPTSTRDRARPARRITGKPPGFPTQKRHIFCVYQRPRKPLRPPARPPTSATTSKPTGAPPSSRRQPELGHRLTAQRQPDSLLSSGIFSASTSSPAQPSLGLELSVFKPEGTATIRSSGRVRGPRPDLHIHRSSPRRQN